MKPPGISVDEGSDPIALSIVEAFVISETRWACPKCNTRWSKPGIHSGVLKTCRKNGCGAKFFLRRDTD
jgi:hypothetical protein